MGKPNLAIVKMSQPKQVTKPVSQKVSINTQGSSLSISPATTFSNKGWDDEQLEKKKGISWDDTPVADWGPKKFLLYFSHLYYQRFHDNFDWLHPIASNYASLSTALHGLSAELGFDCTNEIFKDYIEWFFNTHAAPLMYRHKFNIWALKDIVYLHEYVIKRKPQMLSFEKAPEVVTADVKKDQPNLHAAFKMGPTYFVTNYGPVLYANYLVLVRGKGKEEAISLTIAAVERAVMKDPTARKEVTDSVDKWNPYSADLPITNVKLFGYDWMSGIRISDDKKVLSLFEEIFKKPNENAKG